MTTLEKILPAQVTFILCEFARQEQGGKLSLLGVFGGNDIRIFGATESTAAMPSLALVFVVDGGAGTFDSSVALSGPGIDNAVLPMVVELNGIRGTVIAQLFGVPLTPGLFTAHLKLDGKSYEHGFKVIFEPSS